MKTNAEWMQVCFDVASNSTRDGLYNTAKRVLAEAVGFASKPDASDEAYQYGYECGTKGYTASQFIIPQDHRDTFLGGYFDGWLVWMLSQLNDNQ